MAGRPALLPARDARLIDAEPDLEEVPPLLMAS